MSNTFGPLQRIRGVCLMMPAATADDWAVIARRMIRIPPPLDGHRESLAAGAGQGLFAAPRQVTAVTDQLGTGLSARAGAGWFAEFAAAALVPPALHAELDTAAAAAAGAIAGLRDWMITDYLPRAAETPDSVGEERYCRSARMWTGAHLDLGEVYEWGWSQYQQLRQDSQAEARHVLPGSAPLEAMRYLDEFAPAVEGVEQVRLRLEQMMDDAMTELNGTHFDLAEPLRVVEARIAPSGRGGSVPHRATARPGTWRHCLSGRSSRRPERRAGPGLARPALGPPGRPGLASGASPASARPPASAAAGRRGLRDRACASPAGSAGPRRPPRSAGAPAR